MKYLLTLFHCLYLLMTVKERKRRKINSVLGEGFFTFYQDQKKIKSKIHTFYYSPLRSPFLSLYLSSKHYFPLSHSHRSVDGINYRNRPSNREFVMNDLWHYFQSERIRINPDSDWFEYSNRVRIDSDSFGLKSWNESDWVWFIFERFSINELENIF